MLHASRSPCRRVLALVLLVSVRATSCPCRIALCTGSSGARDRSSPLSPCPQPVHCALARIAPVLALALDRLTPGRSLGALLFLSLHFLWKQKQESSYHPCPLSHTIPHRHIRGGAHLSGVQRATRNAGRRGRGKCARADNTQHTTHNTQKYGGCGPKSGTRHGLLAAQARLKGHRPVTIRPRSARTLLQRRPLLTLSAVAKFYV